MSTSGGHSGAPDGTPSPATLPPHEWTSFHDVRWPGMRWESLDHVVVGPPGVFVIDSTHLPGTIALRDGRLLQDGHPADHGIGAAAGRLGANQLIARLAARQPPAAGGAAQQLLPAHRPAHSAQARSSSSSSNPAIASSILPRER